MSVLNLITGIALLTAGLCLLGRGVLLSRHAVGWPSAPRYLVLVIEATAVVQFIYGAFLVTGRVQSTSVWLCLTLVWMALEAAAFLNLVLQREART